jgi:hypothetical protein
MILVKDFGGAAVFTSFTRFVSPTDMPTLAPPTQEKNALATLGRSWKVRNLGPGSRAQAPRQRCKAFNGESI